jgi:hypothetical protein
MESSIVAQAQGIRETKNSQNKRKERWQEIESGRDKSDSLTPALL